MRFVLFILGCICCMFLSACGHTLSSESGLYNVELRQHVKMPIDGVWSWGKGNPYVNKKAGYIYIAPLDISNISEDEPELAPLMIPQMHDYMVNEFADILREMNRANNSNWQLSATPEPADIHIRTALVHFDPQRPWLRILGKMAGYLLPVPGVERAVGVFSKGDICIEASIRDAKSGQLLMAFKDSNQKTTKLYSKEAYSTRGNADANLRVWAFMLAHLCRAGAPDQLGHATLQQKFTDYTYAESLRDKIKIRL